MASRENRPADEPPRPAPRSTPRRLEPRIPTSAPKAKKSQPAVKILIQTDPSDGLETRSWFDRFKQEFLNASPAMLVSVAIHLVVLMLLGMVVYQQSEGPEASNALFTTFFSDQDAADFQRRLAQAVETVEIEAVSVNQPQPNTTKGSQTEDSPEPEQADAAPANGGVADVPVSNAPQVGRAMTGRSQGQKQSLMKMFGGTRQSEDAVGRGLGWLAKQQQSDGRWELHRGYDNPGRATLRTDTGATAMALLCYLGAGYTHLDGKYKDVVGKGLTWLKKIQKPDGNLHDWEELGRHTAFYAHGQGTIVLCEAYGLTHDKTLFEPARKALQFLYDSQNVDGGWHYQPGAAGDLSVTGWPIMALQSARMAGFDVPEEVLARASVFLNSVSSEQGSRYRYKASDRPSSYTPALTAEGLLCRQFLGWPKDHPALQNGVAWLLEDQNLPTLEEGKRNVYYWYYATQVMHHMEGEAWDRWNAALRDKLVSTQAKGGKLAGSWHPQMGEGHDYGEANGRLYVTCLAILTLEVYYRHLPVYRQDAVSNGANE